MFSWPYNGMMEVKSFISFRSTFIKKKKPDSIPLSSPVLPDVDLFTPPLDGTILPGITRASCLYLAQAHTTGKIALPGIPPSQKLHTHELPITMADLFSWSEQGKMLEVLGVGTAVSVAAVSRIGYKDKDVVLPSHDGGLGPVGKGLWTMITDIQTGRMEFEDWSVVL